MPTITVCFFAGAQAAAGHAAQALTLAEPITLTSLTDELARQHGEQLARVLNVSSFLIDGEAASPGTRIRDGAQVDVLPPFAGG
jgi:molybdopterin synthase sulfur carrier subunit